MRVRFKVRVKVRVRVSPKEEVCSIATNSKTVALSGFF